MLFLRPGFTDKIFGAPRVRYFCSDAGLSTDSGNAKTNPAILLIWRRYLVAGACNHLNLLFDAPDLGRSDAFMAF
jgi:hypothetical protein